MSCPGVDLPSYIPPGKKGGVSIFGVGNLIMFEPLQRYSKNGDDDRENAVYCAFFS